MKKKMCAAAVLASICTAGISLAAGKSSADLGRELFNDPKLGDSSNESSCNSCHANGKGLESAGENKKLVKLVNSCLVDKMAGNKIDGRSVAMRSLKLYIKSLGK